MAAGALPGEQASKLRAIAVDDEPLALEHLRYLAVRVPGLDFVKTFVKPRQALDWLQSNHQAVDLVFLDISMPHWNGLEIAEIIQQSGVDVDVVFVTAYNEYALDAFRVHALDYLLKPIEVKAIQEVVDLYHRRRGQRPTPWASKGRFMVRTFGGLCIDIDGRELGDWKTKKAEELFSLVLHNGRRKIHRERLMEILWPEMDQKRASNNLYTVSYYVRKCLKEHGLEDFFVRDKEQYYVKLDEVEVDYVRFSRGVQTLHDHSTMAELAMVADIYRGRYFGESGYSWCEAQAVWFENCYLDLRLQIADGYKRQGDLANAISCLRLLLGYLPYSEKAYERLLSFLYQAEHIGDLRYYYNQYERMMVNELGLPPSDEVTRLWRHVQRRQR